MTRREWLALAGVSPLFGQGMSRRSVKAMPRGKPSGLPFHARFTDVAAAAGLRAPVIYGGVDRKDYLLETVGCGVAFLDFDNDGWLDIFVLSGSRLSGAPAGATNRLYRNNRDGTFTDVTEKAGLHHTGWASSVAVGDFNNDGFDDLFVTGWGQNILYRNNGDGTFTDVTAKAGHSAEGQRVGLRLHVRRLQSRRPARSVRGALCGFRFAHGAAPGRSGDMQLEGRAGAMRASRSASGRAEALSQ